MGVNGSSQDDGAQVIHWQCESTSNSRFVVTPVLDGDVRLVAAHSGKCATVVENGHLAQRACAEVAEQIFTRKAGAGGVQFVSKSINAAVSARRGGNLDLTDEDTVL